MKVKKTFNVSIDIINGMEVEANSEEEAIQIVENMDLDTLYQHIRNYGSVSIGDVVDDVTEEKEIV